MAKHRHEVIKPQLVSVGLINEKNQQDGSQTQRGIASRLSIDTALPFGVFSLHKCHVGLCCICPTAVAIHGLV